MKTLFIALALTTVVESAMAQKPAERVPANLRASASVAALRFLDRLGMKGLASSRPIFTTRDGETSVEYGGDCTITVDQKGTVVWFENNRRINEQVKRLRSHVPFRFTTEAQVKKLAANLKSAAELLAPYELLPVRIYRRNDPQSSDANQEGVCVANYEYRPNGYSYYNYAVMAHAEFDPVDGALTVYFRHDESVVESSVIRISAAQASAIAAAALQPLGYRITRPSHIPLAYACPNGAYGGLRYPDEKPHRLRLAYGFDAKGKSYGTIWIDAANGRVLGGQMMRY